MADPNDIMLMARTMWGENTHATPDEYAAIANVMRNRLLSGDPQYSGGASSQLGAGNSMSRIVLAPHQFQAWDNPNAANYPMKAPLRSPAFQAAYRIAGDVMSGQNEDPTHGAVNYYNPDAPGQKTPAWAKGREGQQIGSHKFYGPASNGGLSASDTALLKRYEPPTPSEPSTQVAGAPQAAPSQPQALNDRDEALLDRYHKGAEAPPSEEPSTADKQMQDIQGQDTLEGIIGASMREDPTGTKQAILTGTAAGLPMAAAGGAMAAGAGAPLLGLARLAAPGIVGEELYTNFEHVKMLYNLLRGAE